MKRTDAQRDLKTTHMRLRPSKQDGSWALRHARVDSRAPNALPWEAWVELAVEILKRERERVHSVRLATRDESSTVSA